MPQKGGPLCDAVAEEPKHPTINYTITLSGNTVDYILLFLVSFAEARQGAHSSHVTSLRSADPALCFSDPFNTTPGEQAVGKSCYIDVASGS